MEPGLLGVVVGATIAGLVSVTLAVVNPIGRARHDSARQLHERQIAKDQREHELAIAHEDREHARMEKRYDDLKVAYVRFASEMRRIVQRTERSELEHHLRGEEPAPGHAARG